MAKGYITFDGIVDKAVYESDNYNVYAVSPIDGKDIKMTKYFNTTVIGTLPLNIGSRYTFNTKEEYNQRYDNYQYKIISIEKNIPKTNEEVKLFLSEILVPQHVEELMNNYPDIIDIVMQNRQSEIDVKKLYNIGEYRLNLIVEKIKENYMFLDLINYFSE